MEMEMKMKMDTRKKNTVRTEWSKEITHRLRVWRRHKLLEGSLRSGKVWDDARLVQCQIYVEMWPWGWSSQLAEYLILLSVQL